ncbi:17801_t:CDS:1, partial [Dentiscutata erythropus]
LSIDPTSNDANNKRNKKPVYVNVESAIALWVKHVIDNKQTLTSYLIQNKAKEFAQLLNEDKFNASNRWLQNFKQRHNIREYKRQGEANSASLDKLPKFRSKLQSIIQSYQLGNVFNCDETSLYYRLELSRTLAIGPVSGTKKAKDHVTVLLTANTTGSERLKPLFIQFEIWIKASCLLTIIGINRLGYKNLFGIFTLKI